MSSKNSIGRSWEPVWIPYHDGFNNASPLSLSANPLTSRQDRIEGKCLSWTHGRSLIDRANFIKWDTDGTQSDRNHNVNSRFMFNRTEEDVNIFRRLFHENLTAFHNEAQVQKSKIKSCPETSRVVHVVYCANSIQSNDLIVNVPKVTEKEKGSKIEISIHQKAAFQTDSKRKLFYKTTTDHTKRNVFTSIIEKYLPYIAPPQISRSSIRPSPPCSLF